MQRTEIEWIGWIYQWSVAWSLLWDLARRVWRRSSPIEIPSGNGRKGKVTKMWQDFLDEVQRAMDTIFIVAFLAAYCLMAFLI